MLTIPCKNHNDLPTRGFLFIGDPHLWSRQPGRRLDASFLDTVLGKMEWAAELANNLGLQPLILGDLLHADRDQDTRMMVRLARALKKFKRKPMTLLGNHERDELQLTERNPLMLLQETDQIEVLGQSGAWGVINISNLSGENKRVLVGGTPYGMPIPTSLAELAGLTETATHNEILSSFGVDEIVWLTHEDLAFDSAYPGSQPIHSICGAGLAVNGHMHKTSRPYWTDGTIWHNPGNITRMSVDLADHKPSVWEWNPWMNDKMVSIQGIEVKSLRQHVIPHANGAAIFILEGRRAEATVAAGPAIEVVGSRFAAELAVDRSQLRTDDGAFVRETLAQDFEAHKSNGDVQRVVLDLLERATQSQQSCLR
jgi:hypothetical protein